MNISPMLFKLRTVLATRGGVEDTRLETKTKDQGHGRKCFHKKKVIKKVFQAISNL